MHEDHTRFCALVERHRSAVYRTAFRILSNADDALDVMQETFLKLAGSIASVDDEAARAWLMRVAANRALDAVRKRDPVRGALPLDERAMPARSDCDHTPDAAERRARVARALVDLPRRQFEVINLRVYGDCSFGRIATTLGISEGAAKTHYRRALEALKPKLAPLREPRLTEPSDHD